MIEGPEDPRVLELLGILAAETESGIPTAEELCDGHAPQLAFTLDDARWIIALCSRRAGKTTGIAYRKLRRALRSPCNQVYIALTKDQARTVTMWEPIWKPLLRRLGIPAKHDETRMITTFPNGSVIRFTGTDDVRHIETELGSALDEATIDEAQSQSVSVLGPLVNRILPPALSDRRGSLVLAGTVPDVGAGLFWQVWSTSNWSKHNWSMFDNPFMPNARLDLEEYLAQNPGLSIDSPIIQRERFGRFVFDASATAYTYSRALNGYAPDAPDWLAAAFSSGLDYCHPVRDGNEGAPRYGLMASRPLALLPPGHVQHLFDWSSPRGAKLSTHQYYAVAALAQRHYAGIPGKAFSFAIDPGANVDRISIQGVCWNSQPGGYVHWRYDAGSSQNTIDNLRRDYGIAVMLAARKTDLRGQVDRANDVLTRGREHVMIGSALEQDLETARWDKDAAARGQLKWSSNWHPDPSEAHRYALQDYFAAHEKEPEPKYATEIEAQGAAVTATIKAKFENWKPSAKSQRGKPDLWGRGWRPR